MPPRLRIAGASGVGVIGIGVGALTLLFPRLLQAEKNPNEMGTGWTTWRAVEDLPGSAWWSLRPMFAIISVSLITFCLIAIYLMATRQRRLAIIALAASMIPIGLCMIDGVARTAPHFS